MDEGISIMLTSFLKITFTHVFLIIKVQYIPFRENVEIREKYIKRRKEVLVMAPCPEMQPCVWFISMLMHICTCDQQKLAESHTVILFPMSLWTSLGGPSSAPE